MPEPDDGVDVASALSTLEPYPDSAGELLKAIVRPDAAADVHTHVFVNPPLEGEDGYEEYVPPRPYTLTDRHETAIIPGRWFWGVLLTGLCSCGFRADASSTALAETLLINHLMAA